MTRHLLATVLSLRGAAAWATKDTSAFEPLGTDSRPGSGNVLRTADGAKVNVAFFPGALAQIGSNTELQIQDLALTKDGNETDDGIRERVARLELKYGSILTLLDPAARFTIATPGGTINVTPDCLLLVQIGKTKARLTCARGKIQVRRLDGTNLALEAGYVLESTGSDTAVKPAADDPRAQVEVANATAAEQELRELQSRRSAQAPFLSASR